MPKLRDELAEDLRRDIEAGKYKPGEKLPTERALQAARKVSRNTAQGALKRLVTWGLAVARHGVGYVVSATDDKLRWIASDHERGGDHDQYPNDSWSRQMRLAGRIPGEKLLSVGQIPAGAEQAARLEVEAGTVLVVRRRLRTVDGEPHMIADSYYPYELVKDTPVTLPGDVQPGVFKIFEGLGRPWTSNRRDRTTARMPTPEEAGLLRLPQGQPVLQLARVSRDRAGIPVRLAVFVLRGDRGEIEHDYEEE